MLAHLDVSGCILDDSGVRALANGCPQLTELEYGNPNVERRARSHVTSVGMQAMADRGLMRSKGAGTVNVAFVSRRQEEASRQARFALEEGMHGSIMDGTHHGIFYYNS